MHRCGGLDGWGTRRDAGRVVWWAVEGALAFYERSTGEPLGKVLRTVVCVEGDLNVGGGLDGSAGVREPRRPHPRPGEGHTDAALP